MMKCPHCSMEIPDIARHCPHCGAAVGVETEVPMTPPVYMAPAPREMTEDDLPAKYRPLGAWGYFGYSLLFSLPVVGFILLIVFSCNGSNINRRNYARSYWCGLVLVAIVAVIVAVLAMVFGAATGGAEAFTSYYG